MVNLKYKILSYERHIYTYCFTVILLIASFNVIAQTKVDKRFVGIEAEINKILKDHHAANCSQFELAPSFYFLM
jgi:hypothetical protein